MITLWDGYTVTADDFQYILGRTIIHVSKNTGRRRNNMQDPTYHKTLTQALVSFHGKMLKKCIAENLLTLAQALQASKQIEERIRHLVLDVSFDDLEKKRHPQKYIQ